MDSILFLGERNPKLSAFLGRLGYEVIVDKGEASLREHLDKALIDIVVIDATLDNDAFDLAHVLRAERATKSSPIVFIAPTPAEERTFRELKLDHTEVLTAPYSPGQLASKIATLMRLRKLNGKEDAASLAEMNASLRDLNDRLGQELKEARHIQQGLLPSRLPDVTELDFAASYHPLEELGGDWYYVKKEKSGNFSLQIADVTGHGLSAAFIGSMTKLAMAAANKEQPDELLKEMNRLMAPEMPQGRFVTMASFLFDPRTGKLLISNAGHPPAVILSRATNTIYRCQGKGFPIGFFEDSDYQLESVTLEPGDVLVAYTDGVSEVQNRKFETYGTDRVGEALARVPPKTPAAQILAALIADFTEFRDGRVLKDDVTLFVLQRL